MEMEKGLMPRDFYRIAQSTPHSGIDKTIEKYMKSFARYEEHLLINVDSMRSFARASRFVDEFHANRSLSRGLSPAEAAAAPKLVVLDSGVGRGMSTHKLAARFPDCAVIGVDRSAARLRRCGHFVPNAVFYGETDAETEARQRALLVHTRRSRRDDVDDDEEDDEEEEDEEEDEVEKRESEDQDENVIDAHSAQSQERRVSRSGGSVHTQKPPNALLLQAELATFWLLAARKSDWTIHSHYMLHPNPFEKQGQYKKRWQGHPAFVLLLALGGEFVLRSNWKTYCEEFDIALRAAKSLFTKDQSKIRAVGVSQFGADQEPLSHFERKFVNVGAPVFEWKTSLDTRSPRDRQLFLDGLRLFDKSHATTFPPDEVKDIVRIYRTFLQS